MTIQLRTKDDLEKVLNEGISFPWKINHEHLKHLTHVEIYSFDGTAKIIATFDLVKTRILSDGKEWQLLLKTQKLNPASLNGMVSTQSNIELLTMKSWN